MTNTLQYEVTEQVDVAVMFQTCILEVPGSHTHTDTQKKAMFVILAYFKIWEQYDFFVNCCKNLVWPWLWLEEVTDIARVNEHMCSYKH